MRTSASLICLLLTAAAVAQAAVPVATDHVVINEVFANPAGNEAGNEWVEIYNPSPVAVDLTGWTIVDAVGKTQALSGTIPGLGLRLFYIEHSQPVLNNGGDLVLLRDGDGSLVDSLDYYGIPFAEGQSIARHYLTSEDGLAIDGGWYVDDDPSPNQHNDRYFID